MVTKKSINKYFKEEIRPKFYNSPSLKEYKFYKSKNRFIRIINISEVTFKQEIYIYPMRIEYDENEERIWLTVGLQTSFIHEEFAKWGDQQDLKMNLQYLKYLRSPSYKNNSNFEFSFEIIDYTKHLEPTQFGKSTPFQMKDFTSVNNAENLERILCEINNFLSTLTMQEFFDYAKGTLRESYFLYFIGKNEMGDESANHFLRNTKYWIKEYSNSDNYANDYNYFKEKVYTLFNRVLPELDDEN